MRKKQIEMIAVSINDTRLATRPYLVPPFSAYEIRENEKHGVIFDSLARSIADCIASETARFQRSKFLAQCGVERP